MISVACELCLICAASMQKLLARMLVFDTAAHHGRCQLNSEWLYISGDARDPASMPCHLVPQSAGAVVCDCPHFSQVQVGLRSWKC